MCSSSESSYLSTHLVPFKFTPVYCNDLELPWTTDSLLSLRVFFFDIMSSLACSFKIKIYIQISVMLLCDNI